MRRIAAWMVVALFAAATALAGDDAAQAGNEAAPADFVEACLSSTNLERPICECAGKRAKADLSADGYAFLVASLNDDEAKTTELRTKMPVPEIMKASMFMVNAPAKCAAAAAGQ